MTNNHCPAIPAAIDHKPEHEAAIAKFGEKIQDMISEFAETYSMDEMLILDRRIADSWTECPRCESKVCEMQGNAYGHIIKEVMAILQSEF